MTNRIVFEIIIFNEISKIRIRILTKRNESNLLRFLVLRNESTKRIFGKQAYETNPRYESLEVQVTKRIHETNL